MPHNVGFDPACGTGALLLALYELGVQELHGHDIDELALSVAKIAIPDATLTLCDAFSTDVLGDVVVGNPPFISVGSKPVRCEMRCGNNIHGYPVGLMCLYHSRNSQWIDVSLPVGLG